MKSLQRIVYSLFILAVPYVLQAQTNFTAEQAEGCTPLRVKFNIDPATVDLDTIVSVIWDFGMGEVSNAIDPDTVIYEEGGLYTVSLTINGDNDNMIIRTDYIIVYQTISSAFIFETYDDAYSYRFIPLDQIEDTTRYTYTWQYLSVTDGDTLVNSYVNINSQNQPNAIDSVLLDTGIYYASLNIVHQSEGCSSSLTQRIVVADELILPNVFVVTEGEYYIIDPQNNNTILHIEIFNRYGMKVFDQESPIINWNGESNWGTRLNTGVYYFVLEAVEGDPLERYSQSGFIHLYRQN